MQSVENFITATLWARVSVTDGAWTGRRNEDGIYLFFCVHRNYCEFICV